MHKVRIKENTDKGSFTSKQTCWSIPNFMLVWTSIFWGELSGDGKIDCRIAWTACWVNLGNFLSILWASIYPKESNQRQRWKKSGPWDPGSLFFTPPPHHHHHQDPIEITTFSRSDQMPPIVEKHSKIKQFFFLYILSLFISYAASTLKTLFSQIVAQNLVFEKERKNIKN